MVYNQGFDANDNNKLVPENIPSSDGHASPIYLGMNTTILAASSPILHFHWNWLRGKITHGSYNHS